MSTLTKLSESFPKSNFFCQNWLIFHVFWFQQNYEHAKKWHESTLLIIIKKKQKHINAVIFMTPKQTLSKIKIDREDK